MADGPALHRRLGARKATTVCLVILTVLAAGFVAWAASTVLIPVAFAILLNLVLSPVVRWLRRRRIPNRLGAAMVMSLVVLSLCAATYGLSGPLQGWIERAPDVVRAVESKLRGMDRPLAELTEAIDRVENMGNGDDDKVTVEVEPPAKSAISRIYVTLSPIIIGLFMTLLLAYFLLASGDMFLRKFVALFPSVDSKSRARHIVQRIESEVSVYLGTITIINAMLGVAIGITLYILGVPNPVMWGCVAAVLNYIPYVGALVGIISVGAVSFVAFDSSLGAIAPPLSYLVLTTVEAWMVTPAVLGHRLQLNPVMVVGGLMLWGFLWGPAGLLIAVPILAVTKIVCDGIDSLRPYSEFLGN